MLTLFVAGIVLLTFSLLPSSITRSPPLLLQAAGVLMGLFAVGGWITFQNKSHKLDSISLWLKDQKDEKIYLWLQVLEPPVEKSSYKLSCAIKAVGNSTLYPISQGEVLVYFRKAEGFEPPAYGQQFIVYTNPKPIPEPGNPGGFSYKDWCARGGIYYQLWADSVNTTILAGFYGSKFQQLLYELRNNMLRSIRAYIKDPGAAGIAEALLVGYRYGVDAELNDAYTKTGVVHIIAISGMHLSMIFGMLSLIPVNRTNRTLFYIKTTSIGLVIWLFTLLAGAAPSILRAAVMLTITMSGTLLSRRSGSINTLFAAAFFLLLVNPMYLWDVGFQLSFSAVAGLLLFSRPLSNLFQPRHPLLRLFWDMQVVSIAAQTLTTPLVLFHFNQFPILFLLTNLVAIPVSGLVLYLEILFCVLLWLPPAAAILATTAEALLIYMNNYILLLSELPFCVAYPLTISVTQTILMYVGFTGMVYYLVNKQLNGILILLGSVILFFLYRNRDLQQADKQSYLIVYQTTGRSRMEIVLGREAIKWESSSVDDNTDVPKSVKSSHVYFRIKSRSKIPESVQFVHLHSTKLLPNTIPLIKDKKRKQTINVFWWNANLPQDTAVLRGALTIGVIDSGPPPESRPETVPSIFVMAGGVTTSDAALWRNFCRMEGIILYEVRTHGAFIIPMRGILTVNKQKY